MVTITVVRGLESKLRKGKDDDHIYDEILYSDNHCLSQSDENLPANSDGTAASGHSLPKRKTGKVPSVMPEDKNPRFRTQKMMQQQLLPRDKMMGGKRSMQQGSKDSGLSSGSSNHQDSEEPHQGRLLCSPGPLVGDSHLQQLSRTGSGGGSTGNLLKQQTSCQSCRTEGNYEVEVSLSHLAISDVLDLSHG